MNEVLKSLLRQVLTSVATALAAKGYFESGVDTETIIAGLVALLNIIWSVLSRRKAEKDKLALSKQLKSEGLTPVVEVKK